MKLNADKPMGWLRMRKASQFGVNGRFLDQRVTGVQRYARNIVKHLDIILQERGHCWSIFTPANSRGMPLTAMRKVNVGPFSGHLWEQTTLPINFTGRLLNLCNTAPLLQGDQIVCIHDANIFLNAGSYNLFYNLAYRSLQPALARKRFTKITTVSHYSAKQISDRLTTSVDDISVLPNGHEHVYGWDANASKIGAEIVENIKMRRSRTFVLMLGSQAKHKNVAIVNQIAPGLELLKIDIVVAGGGDAIFQEIIDVAAPNVHMLGYVTDDDLAKLMQEAVCLIFPSWTEGFGLPIIEAMALCCPVVSSDRACMPEICGQAALMAAPDNPRQWIDCIAQLADSEVLRLSLVSKGQARIKSYTWDKTALNYFELMTNHNKS